MIPQYSIWFHIFHLNAPISSLAASRVSMKPLRKTNASQLSPHLWRYKSKADQERGIPRVSSIMTLASTTSLSMAYATSCSTKVWQLLLKRRYLSTSKVLAHLLRSTLLLKHWWLPLKRIHPRCSRAQILDVSLENNLNMNQLSSQRFLGGSVFWCILCIVRGIQESPKANPSIWCRANHPTSPLRALQSATSSSYCENQTGEKRCQNQRVPCACRGRWFPELRKNNTMGIPGRVCTGFIF